MSRSCFVGHRGREGVRKRRKQRPASTSEVTAQARTDGLRLPARAAEELQDLENEVHEAHLLTWHGILRVRPSSRQVASLRFSRVLSLRWLLGRCRSQDVLDRLLRLQAADHTIQGREGGQDDRLREVPAHRAATRQELLLPVREQREAHDRHLVPTHPYHVHPLDSKGDVVVEELLQRRQGRGRHQPVGALTRAPAGGAPHAQHALPAQFHLRLGARAVHVQVHAPEADAARRPRARERAHPARARPRSSARRSPGPGRGRHPRSGDRCAGCSASRSAPRRP